MAEHVATRLSDRVWITFDILYIVCQEKKNPTSAHFYPNLSKVLIALKRAI
jgi:hypothetical protein